MRFTLAAHGTKVTPTNASHFFKSTIMMMMLRVWRSQTIYTRTSTETQNGDNWAGYPFTFCAHVSRWDGFHCDCSFIRIRRGSAPIHRKLGMIVRVLLWYTYFGISEVLLVYMCLGGCGFKLVNILQLRQTRVISLPWATSRTDTGFVSILFLRDVFLLVFLLIFCELCSIIKSQHSYNPDYTGWFIKIFQIDIIQSCI